MRSGSIPTYQVVGFGKAVEMAMVALKSEMPRLDDIVRRAEDDFEQRLGAKVNGNRKSRLPNILSVTLPGLDGGVTCGILCSKYGVCASSGSACGTASPKGSHVLAAMGRKDDSAHTLRFSLSRYTSGKDVRLATARLEAAVRESKERSLV
jgi:cysteine desulfurase